MLFAEIDSQGGRSTPDCSLPPFSSLHASFALAQQAVVRDDVLALSTPIDLTHTPFDFRVLNCTCQLHTLQLLMVKPASLANVGDRVKPLDRLDFVTRVSANKGKATPPHGSKV